MEMEATVKFIVNENLKKKNSVRCFYVTSACKWE